MIVRRPHWRLGFSLLRKDEGGAIAVLTAILLTVLIGIVGLAIDVGMWYQTNRALQNAADAAVVAAATNGTDTYQSEAKAVVAQYGFVDGTNGITVTALNNQSCPSGATDCYKVTVAQASGPLFFSAVLGLSAPAVSGAAMASSSATHSYCMLALATSGNAIRTNGASSANMNGCSVMSNGSAKCDGTNLRTTPNGPTYGDAAGTNTGCGVTEHSNVSPVADPYASLASSIPSPSPACSSYPQENSHGSGLSSSNQLSGLQTWGATKTYCGDLQLTGNVTLTTASPGTVLLIVNGRLDTNGYTLATDATSHLTIIFTGTTSGSYNHFAWDSSNTNGGLNIMAPTSGTWEGIALYQNPTLTSGVDFTFAGNKPFWNITGAVYLPNSSVTFSGAINKSQYGASCLLFVVGNITISGTAAIEQTTAASCASAGATLPTNNVGGIALVM